VPVLVEQVVEREGDEIRHGGQLHASREAADRLAVRTSSVVTASRIPWFATDVKMSMVTVAGALASAGDNATPGGAAAEDGPEC
jgi:hypothetical protein